MGDQRLQVSTVLGIHKKADRIVQRHHLLALTFEENYLADALATLATMSKVNANAEAQLVKLEV